MKYEEFKNKLRELLQERMGTDAEIKLVQIEANNGIVRDELVYMYKDENLIPGLRMEELYEKFQEFGLEWCVNCAECIFINRVNLNKYAVYKSWDEVKKHVRVKVINAKWNKERLEDVPHLNYMDLAVVFTVAGIEDDVKWSGFTIKYHHLEYWNIGPAELFETALASIYQEEFDIKGVKECTKDEQLNEDGMEDEWMYIMTNKDGILGASAIIRMDLIQQFAEKMQSDLYIFASSVNEIILIPTNKFDNKKWLEGMMDKFNQFAIRPEERLSENLYYYSRRTGSVEMIDK